MRSLQPRFGLGLLLGVSAVAMACSTPGGLATSSAALSAAPSAASEAPPSASASPSSSGSQSGGGRGDYDYDYGTGASPSAAPAASVEVRIASGELGDYLTDAEGMTLYTFKPDEENVSTCEEACADTWPPLAVEPGGNVAAGEGVGGTLATFERSDGTVQVSYDGAPLYFFAGDAAPGDVNGHGAGDVWFVAVP